MHVYLNASSINIITKYIFVLHWFKSAIITYNDRLVYCFRHVLIHIMNYET